MTPRLLRTGLVALALLVGCGKSGSRRQSDPGGAGGADDQVSAAGESSTSGSAGAAVAGGNGPTASAGGSAAQGGAIAAGAGSPAEIGGAGGEDTAPPLALPDGCRPRTPVETANTCSLAVDCDAAASLRTYCYRLDSGEWECQCANHNSIYRVEDVAGLEACALAAHLCSSDELELGEETCARANESSEANSCVTDVACGSPVDIADISDAQARLMRFDSGRCKRANPSEDFVCSCMSEKNFRTHTLRADSAGIACGPFSDFCVAGSVLTFEGEETCTPTYFASEQESCHRAAACGPEMPLSADVSLLQRERRFASCEASPGGGSDCSCSNPDAEFSFHVATAPTDASCESSIRNCDVNAVRKSTAPATCAPVASEVPGADMCTGLLDCTQDATIDERSVVAQARLQIICRRVETGMPWKCSCGAGADPTVFDLGAPSASAEQACAQAPGPCLERLGGLPLGPVTGFVHVPDPIYD